MASPTIKKIATKHKAIASDEAKWASRAASILEKANPVQRRVIQDTSSFVGILCPRRAGKSFTISSKAVYIGETKPGARILIISLNLKSTKENFWLSAPGGLADQNKWHDLGLTFNSTDHTWLHENGSRGRIAGADTRADIEAFRGASAEADVVFIDEAGSFAPDLLRDLVFEILMPGLMTRGGSIHLAGTPGIVPVGLFYQATSLISRVKTEDAEAAPTCELYDGVPQPEESPLWSLHKWTVQDNIAAPEQWKRALRIKKAKNLTDESPTWRREFLGEWVTDPSELVYYGFLENKLNDPTRVVWTPNYTIDNPTGLPPELGPWNILMGLDLGFEDDTAIVLAGWSDKVAELRVFYTFKSPHLLIDDVGDKILEIIGIFGTPSVMIGDMGAQGKQIVLTINSRYTLSIIPAEKNLKYDFQEILNSEFQRGRVKIPEASDLEDELCTLKWLLDKEKVILVRTQKLKEDPKCPNHLCDALLYLFRYAYHYFSSNIETTVDKNSDAWWIAKEKESLAKMRLESDSFVDPLVFKLKEIKRNDQSIFGFRKF